MRTNWLPLLRRLFVVTLLSCLLFMNTFAQQGDLVMDCKGEVSRLPPDRIPTCRCWVIKYLDDSGKVWGVNFSKNARGGDSGQGQEYPHFKDRTGGWLQEEPADELRQPD